MGEPFVRSTSIMLRYAVLFCLLASTLYTVSATNEAGTKYLEENKKKDGVVTLPSGLQYKVLKKGSGAHHPTVDSPCECHYEGTLIDGTEFDSSYKRGTPTTFAPNQVIKGWTEAMQLMVEGDKWEMYIPSDLAYGESGSPPKIPGGSALVFRMEILKIKGGKKDAITCDPITKEGCNDREKDFAEKMDMKIRNSGKDSLLKELKRLQGMNGGSMKPELQIWIARRINIIKKMTEGSGKKEL